MSDKILLVEDEALIAMSEARIIEKHGFEVTFVHDGEKALETVISDSRISLVLMDIDLGRGMDGTEAARKILEKRDLPIIFLTSHSEKEYVDRTEQISGYGYVLKNSGEFVLVESIRMAYKLFEAYRDMKESEEKYRAAFMTSPDSVNINRLDGLYIDINDGFTDLTGFTREDVIGRFSREIDIWADPEDRNALVKGLEKEGVVENLESVFRCKDGTLKTALMSARIITFQGEPHILSITRDISEKKKIEDRLRSRERRFSAIFEQAADGILIGTSGGVITDANVKMAELTGYMREELIGRGIDMLFDEEELEKSPLEYDRVEQGDAVLRERRIRGKDGRLVPVIMNSKKVEENCLQAIFHDVSNLRRTERSLAESEERFRLAVDGSRDGVWDWNLVTDEAFHSDRFATMLGYEPEDLPYTNEAWSSLIHPDDREEAFRKVETYLSGKSKVYESTFRMRTKDGNFRWISGRGKAVFGEDGKPLRFVGFNTDVTEYKRAEGEARKAKLFLDTISDIAYEADTQGKLTYVNPATERITGFTVEKLAGSSFRPLFRKEDQPSLMEIYRRTLEGEVLENTLTFVNGTTCHFTTLPRYDENGEIVGTFGIARDITERTYREEESRREKELFRQMFMQHSAVQLLIDPQGGGRIVEANKAAVDFYGYSRDELTKMSIYDINILSSEEIDTFMRTARERARNRFEFTHRCADGTLKEVEVNSSPIFHNNRRVLYSVIRDISGRKEAEHELGVKNSFLSAIIRNVPAMFYSFRVGEGGISYSPQVEEILGFDRDELGENTMLWHDSIHNEDRPRVDEAIERGGPGGHLDVVYRIYGKDGRLHWLHDVATPLADEEGRVVLYGVAIDISEQKERENELDWYKDIYSRKLLLLEKAEELAHMGSWEWDMISGSWSMSKNWNRIHGVSENPRNSEELMQLAYPDDIDRISEAMKRAREEGKPYDIRHRIIRRDNGEIRYIQANGVVEFEAGTGRTTRTVGVAQDISERVFAEAKYQTLVHTSIDGILIIDNQGGIVETNDAYCAMSGYSRKELLRMHVNDLECTETEKETLRHIEKLSKMGGDRFETRHRAKDSRQFDVEVSASPFPTEDRFVSIIRDITFRKEEEKQLQDSMREKDLLMQELNHRVKNNLMMVSALIGLKNASLGDDVDLSDLEHRIDAIRIIHENLHQSGEIASIYMRDYAEELLAVIFSFAPFQVRVENKIEDMTLATKTAVPLGLIINELATNAVKHGFSAETPALFKVEMFETADASAYILRVGNTGKPFPEGITLDGTETLGLQLVTSLVDQLQGTIELRRTPEPLFSLSFPK